MTTKAGKQGAPGGQGSGDGTGDNTGDENDDTPLNLDTVKSLVAETANAAMASHSTRLKKSLQKDLEESVGKLLSPLMEQIAALSGGAGKTKAEGAGGGDPAEQLAAKYQDTINRLEQRAKELDAQVQSERTEREKERSERLRGEENSALASALREAGVPEGKLRAAIALHKEDGLVGRNDEGKVVYKIQKTGYVDEVELADGVKAWMSSKEGQEFAPARGVGGSGSGPGTGKKLPPNGKPDKKAAARQLFHQAFGGGHLDD